MRKERLYRWLLLCCGIALYLCVSSVPAFAQMSVQEEGNVSRQSFFAAHEAYQRTIGAYAAAYRAVMQSPTEDTVRSYIEYATVLIQKKVIVLRAWAASRNLAVDHEDAQSLFLTDCDDIIGRSVRLRQALEKEVDWASLQRSLDVLQRIRSDYDRTHYRVVRRMWSERLGQMVHDSDEMIAYLARYDSEKTAQLQEQLQKSKSAIIDLRARVDALPRYDDPTASAQYDAMRDVLLQARTRDGVFAQMQEFLNDIEAIVSGAR